MAVPLEPTIDTLEDAVTRTPRVHFCGGKFLSINSSVKYNQCYCIGGTYERFFSLSTNPVHRKIYESGKPLTRFERYFFI